MSGAAEWSPEKMFKSRGQRQSHSSLDVLISQNVLNTYMECTAIDSQCTPISHCTPGRGLISRYVCHHLTPTATVGDLRKVPIASSCHRLRQPRLAEA